MSWGKTIFGCLIGGYALLGLLGGNYAYEQEVKAVSYTHLTLPTKA